MENSERITSVIRRELTDIELMVGMVCLTSFFEKLPRNYKLDAMCLDVCEAVSKFMDASCNEFPGLNSSDAKTKKAREVFFTKLNSLVEYLKILEERDHRQALMN